MEKIPVIIIEDDLSTCIWIEFRFKKEFDKYNATVPPADHIEAAFDLHHTIASAEEKYPGQFPGDSIIIFDWNLPDGKSGILFGRVNSENMCCTFLNSDDPQGMEAARTAGIPEGNIFQKTVPIGV